jgi:hypothetical protein
MELAVLVSQPRKSKAVRRRWIVADDIRGNLELVRMLIDAGIRPLTNAFRSLIRCASFSIAKREITSLFRFGLGGLNRPPIKSNKGREAGDGNPVGQKGIHV